MKYFFRNNYGVTNCYYLGVFTLSFLIVITIGLLSVWQSPDLCQFSKTALEELDEFANNINCTSIKGCPEEVAKIFPQIDINNPVSMKERAINIATNWQNLYIKRSIMINEVSNTFKSLHNSAFIIECPVTGPIRGVGAYEFTNANNDLDVLFKAILEVEVSMNDARLDILSFALACYPDVEIIELIPKFTPPFKP